MDLSTFHFQNWPLSNLWISSWEFEIGQETVEPGRTTRMCWLACLYWWQRLRTFGSSRVRVKTRRNLFFVLIDLFIKTFSSSSYQHQFPRDQGRYRNNQWCHSFHRSRAHSRQILPYSGSRPKVIGNTRTFSLIFIFYTECKRVYIYDCSFCMFCFYK